MSVCVCLCAFLKRIVIINIAVLAIQVQLSISATFIPKAWVIVDEGIEWLTSQHKTTIGLCEVLLSDVHVFCAIVNITYISSWKRKIEFQKYSSFLSVSKWKHHFSGKLSSNASAEQTWSSGVFSFTFQTS